MTVIEYLRDWLSSSGLMDQFVGQHFDYVDQVPNEAGLFSNGINKQSEDILGNEKYQASFQLLSGLHAFSDYDRLKNSDFLTKLAYSLNQIKDVEVIETIDGVNRNALITNVICNNGMLFNLPTGDINDGVIYQLQIQVNYKIQDPIPGSI